MDRETLNKLKSALLLQPTGDNVWPVTSPEARREIWRQALKNPGGFTATSFCLTLSQIITILKLNEIDEELDNYDSDGSAPTQGEPEHGS